MPETLTSMSKCIFYLTDDVKEIVSGHALSIQRDGEKPNTSLAIRQIVSEWASGHGRKTPVAGQPWPHSNTRPFLMSEESRQVIKDYAAEIQESGEKPNLSLAVREIIRQWAKGQGRKKVKAKP